MSIKSRIGNLTSAKETRAVANAATAAAAPQQPQQGSIASRVSSLAKTQTFAATAAAKPAYTHYDDGVCPQCGPTSKMEKFWLDDTEQVFFCPAHSIALPIPLEQQHA